MKILVVGAGAVGGYMGGRLAKAGASVAFLARGVHLEALRGQGLTVNGVEEVFSIPVTAVSEPAPGEVFDLILYCVKAYDLEGVLRQTRSALAGSGIAVSLLNGVESDDLLVEHFGRERVIGGITFIGSQVEHPGVILQTAKASLVLGELDGRETEQVVHLKNLFDGAGIPARISRQIRRDRWRKLVWNAAFNPMCALTELSAQKVLKQASLRLTLIRAMEEVVVVAKALGYDLGPDTIQKQIEATEGAGEIIPSTLQDRQRGKPLEAEAINGVVVRKGEETGVPTPVNQTLYALTLALSTNPHSPPNSR